MHARLVTVTGTANIDSGLAYVRDKVLPTVSQHHGYRGMLATGNRDVGALMVLTWWDSSQDLEADAAAMRPTRSRVDDLFRGDIRVDRLQRVLAANRSISESGQLRIIRLTCEPDTDPQALDHLPWSPTVLIDRAAGVGVALSPTPGPDVDWEDVEVRAAAGGFRFDAVADHEVLLVDHPHPAPAPTQ
jgi:hypothetical protein